MEFRGKVRTILWRSGWPFTKLVISSGQLEVHALFRLVSLKKEEVLKIEVTPGSWPSVKIWNNAEAFPHIEFWSPSLPLVVRALEAHGYEVKKNARDTPGNPAEAARLS